MKRPFATVGALAAAALALGGVQLIGAGTAMAVGTETATITAPDLSGAVNTTLTEKVTVAGSDPATTPTGRVIVYAGTQSIGSCLLASGSCTATIQAVLPGGTYKASVSYAGDATYAATSTNFGLTINAGNTASSVTVANPTVTATEMIGQFDQSGTATGGAGTPTGGVAIYSGTPGVDGTILCVPQTLDGTGAYSCSGVSTGNLPPGAHTLTAVYLGDTTYAPSSQHFTVNVTAATNPTVSADDATGTAGSSFVEPVTVVDGFTGIPSGPPLGTPTGTVTISNGSDTLGSAAIDPTTNVAKVTADTSKLAPGTYTLTANYAGDDFYPASSTTFALTVKQATVTKTTVSAPAAKYGSAGHVTVNVTGATSGKVTLKGAGAAQTKTVSSNGTAVFTLARTLAPKSYALTASYAGGNGAEASTGHATLRVAKATPAKPVVKVTKKPTRKATGKATITVKTASGLVKATGKVKVTLKLGKSTKTVTGTLKAGKVTVKLPKLPKKGTWKLTAKYAGSSYYNAVTSKTVKVKVTK